MPEWWRDFVRDEFLVGSPQWIVPAMMAGGVLLAFVIWNYAKPASRDPIHAAAALLKVLAIALLLICLVQPMRRSTRPRPQANVLPILVDNSQSMQVKGIGDKETRGQQVIRLLGDDPAWKTRLSQDFDVRSYAFDARLKRLEDIEALTMDGYVSSLFASLTSLRERFADRPVGGIVLFTDGNLTDAPSTNVDWSDLGFPIYPVLPAKDEPVRDLRIADVSVRQTDFESSPTTIRVGVDSVAMDESEVHVELRDLATDEVVEEKLAGKSTSGQPLEVSFQFRPERPGVNFYRATVFTSADREAARDLGHDPNSAGGEATLVNNHRVITVDRDSGPYRILYIAGRPNWEFKFLRRALAADAEIQLVGLLRIADKEPKFSFRDRGVSTTNPLFAGLGDDDEDAAQQYDQPVLIRLGVAESEELSDGFPAAAEELFAYHAVILDDVEPSFFSQDQMLLLRRFVSTRGGGLLMLGGQESFDDNKFAGTPLGEMSPVYAPRKSTIQPSGPFQFDLTREGLLHPWLRLRDNESDERQRLRRMTPFTTLSRVGDVKPGASTLATVGTVDGDAVALAAQRFGRGRTAALTIGDVWRWSMRRDPEQRDDAAQAWRQLTRWLVNEVPHRVEVRVDEPDDPSQPVTIVVNARDEMYLPLDNAEIDLQIEKLGGEPLKLSAHSEGEVAGQYTATYWTREPGGYRVTARVADADGSEVGSAVAGWTAAAGLAEFRDLRVNRSLLAEIAEQTGGEIIRDDRLKQFAADLPNRRIPVTERWIYPIWHRPWVMMLAMACLCCEWGLRRWRGLA